METGRPPKYKTVEELQEKVNEYMNNLPIKEKVLSNGLKLKVPVPTISGLAYHLGFSSRQSFYDYEKNKDFSYTIKRARFFIENEYETQLQIGNTTGAIFALKNLGWVDKTEVEQKNTNINWIEEKTYDSNQETD